MAHSIAHPLHIHHPLHNTHDITQQWTRNLVLNDTVNLLEEVADLAAVPERTMRYLHDKEYKAAVALLLTTANKLQRREIKQIGALRDVRRDVAHQRKRLSEKLYYEVLREVCVVCICTWAGVGDAMKTLNSWVEG